ncbi:hypothetical protein FDP41_010484 [Naegleria fowleri]|uniref:Protein kinase domain-containing protein n=1 Tax=Naegleria fowleri TaxID=5763 RepID=A0A6A5CDP1_NAEFO|nr:uncharacterized protein FDP41_010484 [Naegleria fowleri]KAF0983419.1 hypothetical protein FDP41_010484 [Naegleria fowleri]
MIGPNTVQTPTTHHQNSEDDDIASVTTTTTPTTSNSVNIHPHHHHQQYSNNNNKSSHFVPPAQFQTTMTPLMDHHPSSTTTTISTTTSLHSSSSSSATSSSTTEEFHNIHEPPQKENHVSSSISSNNNSGGNSSGTRLEATSPTPQSTTINNNINNNSNNNNNNGGNNNSIPLLPNSHSCTKPTPLSPSKPLSSLIHLATTQQQQHHQHGSTSTEMMSLSGGKKVGLSIPPLNLSGNRHHHHHHHHQHTQSDFANSRSSSTNSQTPHHQSTTASGFSLQTSSSTGRLSESGRHSDASISSPGDSSSSSSTNSTTFSPFSQSQQQQQQHTHRSNQNSTQQQQQQQNSKSNPPTPQNGTSNLYTSSDASPFSTTTNSEGRELSSSSTESSSVTPLLLKRYGSGSSPSFANTGHIIHGHYQTRQQQQQGGQASHDHSVPKIQQRRGQHFPHDRFKIVMNDFTIQITEKNNEAAIVEEYTELKSLGRGGQATVFSALEKSTGERVALKIINAGGNSAQLWNEFNILRVMKHPSIIPVWRLYETKSIFNSTIVLTMPVYIHGDLTGFITKFAPHCEPKNPFTPHCIIDMVLQITDAIQYTHSKGIIHRDLKPDNLFISSLEVDKKNKKEITSCKVTLGDFGLSKNIQQSMAVSVVGTFGWMSPDHLNATFSYKTDMWSLGCIIYYLISLDQALLNTNELINENHNSHKLKMVEKMKQRMNSTSLPQNFEELIDIVINKLLQKNPDDRISSHEFFWDYLIPWRYQIDESELTELTTKSGYYKWRGTFVTKRKVTADQFKTLIQLRDIQYVTHILGFFTKFDSDTQQEEIFVIHKPQGINLKEYLVPSNPRYVSLHDKLEILLKIATAIEEINRNTDIQFIIKLDASKIFIDEHGEVILSILDAIEVQQQPMEKDNIYNLYFFSLDLLDECREIYNYPFEEAYDVCYRQHGSEFIDFPRLLVFVFNGSIVTHPCKYSMTYVSQKLFTQLYTTHRFPTDRFPDRKDSITSTVSSTTSPVSLTPPADAPMINISQSPPSSNLSIITQTLEAERLSPEEQFHCSHQRIKEMIRANSVRHILKAYHIGRDGTDKKWTQIIKDEEEENERESSVETYDEHVYNSLQNYHLHSVTSNTSCTDAGFSKKNPELVNVSIECLSFQPNLFRDYFNGKQMEPLYLYWYLIDIKQKRRISETFCCDVNTKQMKQLLGDIAEEDDPLSVKRSRCSGYEVDSSNSDIMVLFIVSKTLQGNDFTDSYIKPSKNKLTEEKFSKALNGLLPQLQNFQQDFAWACEPLFDFEGNLILPKQIETFYYMDEVRNEHSFYEFFEKRDVKKEKIVPMTLKLHCEMSKSFETTPVTKSDSLTELDASVDLKNTSFYLKQTSNTNNGAYLCKMFTFAPNFMRSLTDSNNLYVYPQSITFKRRSLFLRDNMSIGIIVKFKRDDKDLNGEGEKVFLRKNNKTFNEGYSTVSYHCSSPEFNDEIKVQLPEHLTSSDHFLFTFVDIDCDNDQKSMQVIGYSSFMLLGKHGLLATHGKQSLTIYKRLPPKNYLHGTEEGKKSGEFKVDFQAISTLYTTDINLYEFFSATELVKVMKNIYGDSVTEVQKNINQKLKNLERVVDFRNLIQYMPQIMDVLLLMITLKQYPQVQIQAFDLLNSYLDGLKKTERNTGQYIERYIKESYVNNKESTGFLFEQLLKRFVRHLDDEQKQRAERKNDAVTNMSVYNLLSSGDAFLIKLPNDSLLIENSSIYFQLIEKSLILYMHSNKLLNQHHSSTNPLRHLKKKKDDLPGPFNQIVDLLSELRTLVLKECKFRYLTSMQMAKVLVASYAQLLTGMLNLVDKGFIITEIEMFLDEFLPSKDQQFEQFQELKNIFLKHIASYDHLLVLCLSYSDSSCLQYVKKNGNYIVYHMCDNHYLSGIFIKRFLLDTLHKQRKVREKAAQTFCFLLSRHEYDSRYQTKDARRKIASLYFPFIIIICDLWKTYEELTKADASKNRSEKRPEAQTLLVCFLHILINTRKKVFREWWKQEVPERKRTFIKILSSIPKLFRYTDTKSNYSSMDEDSMDEGGASNFMASTPRSTSTLRAPVSIPKEPLSPRATKRANTVKDTVGRKSFGIPFSKDDSHYETKKPNLSRFSSPNVNKLSHRTSVSILRSQQCSYSQLFRGDSKKKAREQQNRWKRILSIQASISTLRIISWIFEEDKNSSDELMSDVSYIKLFLEFFFNHLEVEQSETTYHIVFQLLALFVKIFKINGFYYSREEVVKKVNEFGARSPVETMKMLALSFTKWMKILQQNEPVPFSNSVNRQSSNYFNPVKPLDRTKSSVAAKFDGTLNISDLLWNIKIRYKEKQYVEQLKSWLNSQPPDVITAVEFLEKEFVKYMYPDDFASNNNEQGSKAEENGEEEEVLSVASEGGEEISIFQALRQL